MTNACAAERLRPEADGIWTERRIDRLAPVRPIATGVQIERYSSIAQVPQTIWQRLASRTAVSLEAGHLRAVEESRINDLHPYYLIGYRAGEPMGFAYCEERGYRPTLGFSIARMQLGWLVRQGGTSDES